MNAFESQANVAAVWRPPVLLDCGGRAQRRHRFGDAEPHSQSGVALRLPPQSKAPASGGSADFQSAVSQVFQPASRHAGGNALNIGTPCRLEIGDTAGWKPALRGRGGRLLLFLCASLLLAFSWEMQAQSVDLRATFRAFQPTILSPGNHPTGLRFEIYNGSFTAVTSSVDVEIYLSRNNTFGDADDTSLGQMSMDITLPWGQITNVVLDAYYASDAALLADFTVPSDACGYYTNLYLKVTFPQGSSYTDPDLNNNVSGLGYMSHVINQTGPAPTVESIARLSPTDSTTDASSVTWQVTFSDSVTGVDSSDFTITRLSGSISGFSITGIQSPSANVANVIANTGAGSGELSLNVPSNPSIYSVCEVRMTAGFTGGETYTLQRTSPLQVIVPVQTNGPVPSVDVMFSGPINPNTFTYADVGLSHAATNVSLNSSVTTSLVSDNTYRINGLAAFTGARGSYVLTVNGSGITGPSGNAGSGMASGSWGNTPLTITSVIVPVQPSGPVSSVDVVFLGPIDPTTFTYQDVTLTRNGSPVSLDVTVNITHLAGNTYRIGGLTGFTGTAGTYVITVDASRITDALGNAGSGSNSGSWNNVPLTVKSVSLATQANGIVSSLDVVFSVAIDPATFTYQDLTLTRDGAPVALAATVTTAFVSGNTYRISGFVPFATVPGIYVLTVNASSITDTSVNPGVGTGSTSWNNARFTVAFTVLTPSGATGAVATAVSGMRQSGYVYIAGKTHAALWSGSAGSFVDLNPPGSLGSYAFGICGNQQVGYVYGGGAHAALWSGTAGSFVDLHPASLPWYAQSQAFATTGSRQGGIGGPSYNVAAVWSGTSSSYAELHSTSASYVYGMAGSEQVGCVYPGPHAALWSGASASLVELHPSSANSSSAFGTTGLNQVGVVDSHAALWSGTAGSFIDLNPAGATDSKAYAVSGSHQAGYVWIGSGQHAAIWSGTAISFVDLHSVLGANYSRSCAKGIWSEGRTTYVAGFADSDAVLWTIRDMHVYVNHSYAGTSSDGSLQTPFKTVTAGYQSVQTNGLITVFSGNYNESVHMDKPLVLSATNGTVNIIGLP